MGFSGKFNENWCVSRYGMHKFSKTVEDYNAQVAETSRNYRLVRNSNERFSMARIKQQRQF